MSSQYSLKIHKRVKKQLEKIDKRFHLRIRRALETLAEDPFSKASLRLEGLKEESYRIKAHPFRILYAVDRKMRTVEVHDILHRREAYRSL